MFIILSDFYWRCFYLSLCNSLAIIPLIVGISLGCFGFFFVLGFLANGAIAALYGKLIIGKKYANLF